MYFHKGLTIRVREMDMRPGGAWRLVTRSPGGVDYNTKIAYDQADSIREDSEASGVVAC
jgi:uncharacterized protein YndB with AHSA1/START domain